MCTRFWYCQWSFWWTCCTKARLYQPSNFFCHFFTDFLFFLKNACHAFIASLFVGQASYLLISTLAHLARHSLEYVFPSLPQTGFIILAHMHDFGGSRTASMMCTTPLVAPTSAVVTLAMPLMVTPAEDNLMDSDWPWSVLTFCVGLRSLLYTAAPATTWYVRTATKSFTFLGSNNRASSALGTLANAAFVGANTVNGPLDCRAPTRSPAFTAITSVDRVGVARASWTMFLVGFGGISTVSMMCTTPLV